MTQRLEGISQYLPPSASIPVAVVSLFALSVSIGAVLSSNLIGAVLAAFTHLVLGVTAVHLGQRTMPLWLEPTESESSGDAGSDRDSSGTGRPRYVPECGVSTCDDQFFAMTVEDYRDHLRDDHGYNNHAVRLRIAAVRDDPELLEDQP